MQKNDGTSVDVNGDFDLEAKVDNQLFTVNKGILTAVIANNAGNAGGYLDIAAYADSAVYFRLRILNAQHLRMEDLKTGQVSDFMMQFYSKGQSWINQKYDLIGVHATNPDGVPDGQFKIDGISETNIWGTFSFVGYNENDGSKVKITDGKFNAWFVQ